MLLFFVSSVIDLDDEETIMAPLCNQLLPTGAVRHIKKKKKNLYLPTFITPLSTYEHLISFLEGDISQEATG